MFMSPQIYSLKPQTHPVWLHVEVRPLRLSLRFRLVSLREEALGEALEVCSLSIHPGKAM